MPVYPNNVATIYEKYGLSTFIGVDLDRRIQQGAELDPEHLSHAQSTASLLRLFLKMGGYVELNEELVRGAELRAKAIENIHANFEYPPEDLLQVLQNMNTTLQAVRAEARAAREEIRAAHDEARAARDEARAAHDEARAAHARYEAQNLGGQKEQRQIR